MNEAHSSLPLFALAGRWAVRVVTGYAISLALLLLSSLIVQPQADWSAVGGLGRLLVDMTFGVVFLAPVLALAGLVEAVAVWLALRASRGSTRAGVAAAGVGGAALYMLFIGLSSSGPRVVDLLGYGAISLVVGAVAAWLTLRDLAGLPSLRGWVQGMRDLREGSVAAGLHDQGDG